MESTTAILATAAGKGARWAWNHQDEIETNLAKFYRASRRKILGPSPGILILGPGGAGKTTLGRILSGKFDFLLDSGGPYEQSKGVQTFQSRKNPNVEVVVGPGQEDRRHATWGKLLRPLGDGKIQGIILCCSYGYHSLSISAHLHRMYQRNAPERFLENYLHDRRMDEVKILETVSQSLLLSPKPVWLLTLVTKEDLWTNREAQVREFYVQGPYGEIVDKLSQQKGSQLFRHEMLFGSLLIENFKTTRGELLQQNVAGYDHIKQVKSLREIIETIAALEKW